MSKSLNAKISERFRQIQRERIDKQAEIRDEENNSTRYDQTREFVAIEKEDE